MCCCHHLHKDLTLSCVVATICTRTYQMYCSSNNTVIYCWHHLHGDSLDLFLTQQHCRLLSSPSAQGPTKFTVHPTTLSSAVANTSTGITIYKIYFIQEQYSLLSPQFTLGSTRISSSSHSTVASCDHSIHTGMRDAPGIFPHPQHCCLPHQMYSTVASCDHYIHTGIHCIYSSTNRTVQSASCHYAQTSTRVYSFIQ